MVGIGVDIISLTRMAETLNRSGEVFLNRAFTPAEVEAGGRCENPTAFFATAWAAKEATFKALVLNWAQDVDLRDMEVTRGPAGEPLMNLSGNVKRIASEKGCAKVLISLSYETEHAIAMVLLLEV